jgi:hypothetical protein
MMQPRASAMPVVAAVALLAAAALALGGTFGTLYVRELGRPPITGSFTRTAWVQVTATGPQNVLEGSVPVGIPLVVGVVLAAVAALMLVLTRRSAAGPGPGRLVGMMAAGLLVGGVAVIWTEVAAAGSSTVGAGLEQRFEFGAGAWLLLSAGVVAVVAIGLLLVPPRPSAYPPPAWQGPPPPPPPGWPAPPPWNGPPHA